MKCPVCAQENSTMLCPRCGFDASRDYARYPTLAPVGKVPSVSAMQRDWHMQDKEKLDQISALLSSLLAVRYLKLIEEDPYVHAANLRRQTLSTELDREKRAARQALIRNRELLDDLTVPSAYSENASQEQRKLEDKIRNLVRSKYDLEITNKALKKEIQIWKEQQANSSRYNLSLVKSIRKLESDVSNLQAALKTANTKNAELEAALEAERGKSILSRIFNR